jgi:hypothetical protein
VAQHGGVIGISDALRLAFEPPPIPTSTTPLTGQGGRTDIDNLTSS